MAREVKKHDRSGYRSGCRCEACRKDHREAAAAWRASRRAPVVVVPVQSEPLVSVPVPEPVVSLGVIEAALAADLDALVGCPPWSGTLRELALFNARLLDQIMVLERLDLVSPIQIRTLEVLDRLRAVSVTGSGDGAGAAAEAAAFLRDLETP